MPSLRLAVLSALLLPLVACGGSGAAEEAGPQGTPVAVVPVGVGDLARAATYAADLQAWADVPVYTKISDRVIAVQVHEGDPVTAGQRLVLVRRAELDKGIEQVAAQIEALDVQVRNGAAELERSRELLAGGVITQQGFDAAEAAYEASVAQRRALQASLDQLALTAGEASVAAPVAGVVADLAVDVGDRTSPQAAVARILVVDPIKVVLDVTEADARLLEPGDPVTVTVPAWPGESFAGTVSRVLPYLETRTRTNTVEVELPNPAAEDGARRLKPGMFGRASIVVDRREAAVVVPARSLVLDPALLARAAPGQDLRKAFVVDAEGKAVEREVEVGLTAGEQVEVTAGLQPGDRLVVRGQHGLDDGEPVRIVEDRS